MVLIISIETATPTCSIAIHENGELLAISEFTSEKSHSQVIAPSIDFLLESINKKIEDLSALAVSSGPGSYTGLRIGTSIAKGLCYANQIPIISISSLESMIMEVQTKIGQGIFCPMIDARRMEVYCKLHQENKTLKEDFAEIVTEESFKEYFREPFYYFGTGAQKCIQILSEKENTFFIDKISPSAKWMGYLAWEKYLKANFEDLAYFEPDYLKEFHTKPSKKLL